MSIKFPIPDALADCENYFIAGGAVLAHLMGKEINDYDVYPKSKADAVAIIEHLYGSVEFVCYTDRAVSFLSYEKTTEGRRVPIQVMHFNEFKDAPTIFKTFDFPVCMVAVDQDGTFYQDPSSFEDLVARRITFNRDSMFPLASLLRLEKYKKKGFDVPISTRAAIAFCATAKGMPSSWEEAEGLVGGYYGRAFKFLDKSGTPFTLDNLLDSIEEVDKSTLLAPMEVLQLDDLLYRINPIPIPHVKINGMTIKVNDDGILGKTMSFGAHALGTEYHPYLIKSYKYAVQRSDRIVSQYNAAFEYRLGGIAKAQHNPWLYSSKVIDYYKRPNGVLLEVYSLPEEVMDYTFNEYNSNHAILQSKRLYVNRIVPLEEVNTIKDKELVQMVTELGPHNIHIYNALRDSTNAGHTNTPSVGTLNPTPWI